MIYLLRHGETEFNVERRIQGSLDSPLTPLGVEQARAMGRTLRPLVADEGFELVSSPLGRAQATTEIVAQEAGLSGPIITDLRLQEIGCGSWEKHHLATLSARDPRIAAQPNFLAAWAEYCSDGEGLDAAIDRLRSWLSWAEGKQVIAVSHGCAGAILRALFTDLDRPALLAGHSASQDRLHRLENGQIEEISE